MERDGRIRGRSSEMTGLDWDRDGAGWPHREASGFVEAAGYRWHVQRAGSGPTVVLIHGTGASTHSWTDVFARLRQRYDVLAMDLPGHGFTCSIGGRPPPAMDRIAAAFAGLLDQLDAKPRLVIGHSAGAAIAARLALNGAIRPDLLVSVNGALEPFPGAAGWAFPMMAKALTFSPLVANVFSRAAENPRRVRRLIEGTGSKPPDAYLRNYAALLRHSGHVSGALALMANWDLGPLWADLPKLEVPALFIAGARDLAVPPSQARRAALRAPFGALEILPGLGHLAHEEAPDAVCDAIARHID
ncbi:MAG: alpha/beta fold hydrolase BchO [Pseudomonadota bacterium]